MDANADSDIESGDEDEVFRNFDEESDKIVHHDLLPEKSGNRYLLNYYAYQTWKQKNQRSLSTSEEKNLIVYFKELKDVKKFKPSTIWSVWSMLKKTMNSRDNIDITKFQNLKAIVKKNSKGYKPTKALAFTWDHVMRFINEAPDNVYLASKVILIFGICGAMRCMELNKLETSDIEDIGQNRFLVSIDKTKNDDPRQFLIGEPFYDRVFKYISLRPSDYKDNTFLINYQQGKCTRQNIGRNKIGNTPKSIAYYLGLPDADRYTGHGMRASSATFLVESGANETMIMELGGWKSSSVAHGYIRKTIRGKTNIFEGITHLSKTLPCSSVSVHKIQPHDLPSTSKQHNSLVFDNMQFQCGDTIHQETPSAVIPKNNLSNFFKKGLPQALPLSSTKKTTKKEVHTTTTKASTKNIDGLGTTYTAASSHEFSAFEAILDEESNDASDDFHFNEEELQNIENSNIESSNKLAMFFRDAKNKKIASSNNNIVPLHFASKAPVTLNFKKQASVAEKNDSPSNKKFKTVGSRISTALDQSNSVPVSADPINNNGTSVNDKNNDSPPNKKFKTVESRISAALDQSNSVPVCADPINNNVTSVNDKNNNVQLVSEHASGIRYENCVFHGNIVNNFYYCQPNNQRD